MSQASGLGPQVRSQGPPAHEMLASLQAPAFAHVTAQLPLPAHWMVAFSQACSPVHCTSQPRPAGHDSDASLHSCFNRQSMMHTPFWQRSHSGGQSVRVTAPGIQEPDASPVLLVPAEASPAAASPTPAPPTPAVAPVPPALPAAPAPPAGAPPRSGPLPPAPAAPPPVPATPPVPEGLPSIPLIAPEPAAVSSNVKSLPTSWGHPLRHRVKPSRILALTTHP